MSEVKRRKPRAAKKENSKKSDVEEEIEEVEEDIDDDSDDSEGSKRGRKAITSYVQITPTYRVGSDARQWKVYQMVSNKDGNEVYQPKMFFGSFHACVQAIFETEIRTSEYNSLEDLANNIQTIKSQIKEALESSGITTDWS